MTYALLHTVHLLAAIGFIGTLFYEVAILARVKPQLDPAQLGSLERALGARTRLPPFIKPCDIAANKGD